LTTIRLSNIAFDGRHGVTANERLGTRRFEVDVDIEAAVEASELSDELRDTIDYSEVAEIVVKTGTDESHHLIESLARRMLTNLVTRFPGANVTLELRKLAPPACPGHPAFAAVRLSGRG
jgi:7,8-dihydroneopterin aldolase/epimerase/oxygenase